VRILLLAAVLLLPARAFAELRPVKLSDDELLELVQKQTVRYFWDFAHPDSGLARERSHRAYGYGGEVVTIGGTGFGVMALVVAAERGGVSREAAAGRLVIPFSRKDDGGDLVETSFLFQGRAGPPSPTWPSTRGPSWS